jgi:hypothetical protein
MESETIKIKKDSKAKEEIPPKKDWHSMSCSTPNLKHHTKPNIEQPTCLASHHHPIHMTTQFVCTSNYASTCLYNKWPIHAHPSSKPA